MDSIRKIAEFYTRRFSPYKDRWIEEVPSPDLRVSIVIPAFDEEGLEKALKSLGSCKLFDASSAEVILVLNHSQRTEEVIRQRHKAQYARWARAILKNGIPVYPIPAFDLPHKKAGVGLARKIGMDEAVKRFSEVQKDGLIVCLDADCTVSPDYIASLLDAEKEGWNGLSIYYEHIVEEVRDKEHREHITRYEIFLRYYSLALQRSAYPFYWQTVGSSMAARVSAYCRTGGMNQRKAGEDFYFLHKLFPQELFTAWNSCTVYPSARLSQRVPFGTGRAMIRAREGEQIYDMLYNPEIFRDLREWIINIGKIWKETTASFPGSVERFLKEEGLWQELENLKERSRSRKQFLRNFSFWLDGLKVLKYIHYAQRHFYSDIPAVEACKAMLGTGSEEERDLLTELRELSKEEKSDLKTTDILPFTF